MTNDRRLSGLAAAAAILLALAPIPARAETREEGLSTPLGLARRAEAIALVRGEAGAAGLLGALRVEEALRGAPAAGQSLPIAGDPARTDLRIRAGDRSIAFLRRVPAGGWEVLDGALGLVAIGEAAPGAAEAPELSLIRTVVEEARPDGTWVAPGRVRAALVAAATGPESRFRPGAALDLLQERDLLAGATEAERGALVEAFRTAENRHRARFHLARLVGVLRPEGAARMLADALLAPDGAGIRPAVGLALADLGDPAAVAHFAARTADASPGARALIAGALGASGLPAARDPLEALLGAAEPAVRLEAAVGVGRLRTADAAPALLRRFRGGDGGAGREGDDGVRRALAWALAQCDAEAAWQALRDAAAAEGTESEAFRAFVRSVLANPRRSFVR